ncbi:D-alanyl-D-alanine carboxypeptidase family protein [Cohnella yongneupensis]|uniref:serine-type D-Ala-D-Ala carboxypeptidase n=1 Tax=Cohnella yongneupensis TaxID=425006 RepID=A0ABW0QZB9_9BACL
MSKRFAVYSVLTSFLFLYVFTAGSSVAFAAETAANKLTTGAVQVQANAAFLMDADSGQVMYQYDADTPRPPASMAKMMTEYLVNKAVKEGRLAWDQTITVGDNAALQDRRGSIIYLAKGEKYTIKDLYDAMAIFSANDATVQLAEAVSSTEEEFAKLMNETAAQLGMTNAHFINSTGLSRSMMPEGYKAESLEGETVMSARDTATLAYTILKEYPETLQTAKIVEKKFRARDKEPMLNWNYMLEENLSNPYLKKFAYQGVDGLKTGHTDEAGNCFTGTALINGTRLIAVVMGVPGNSKDGKRFLETAKLFDYGFHGFEKQTILEAKAVIPTFETLKVKKGKSKKVNVVTATDLTLLVPKGSKTTPEIVEVKPTQDPLMAPIKIGDKVGTATYKYKDPSTLEDKTVTVDLIAAEDVGKASWWRMLFRAIGDFFASLFNGIVNLF